ncbi:hypothetical protein COHA_002126 [Chlorella ohadii]|uniref:Uncharacterized protein n=1 Tax=Chlorella ohadii TaxID=2649997 RepID=A0AAD5DXE4_9CHLO|nr:hypothetical protein COHA_002126 [Chlorella ohadii]
MANRGSFCTLARNMSFEEEPAICLQAAEAAGGPPPAAAPPPLPPPEPRSALQAWLQQLGASGAVQMQPNFDSLVAAEQAEQRRACAASRGWLAPAVPAAPVDPQPSSCGSSSSGSTLPPPAAAVDPKMREALKKVQQLDGALQAAGQRAATVAAQGRELEQRKRDAGAADENCGVGEAEDLPAAGAHACGLEGAMHREHCRLQQEERLRAALEGGAAEETADIVSDCGSTAALSPDQERLVDRLLGQADAEEGPGAAAVRAAQDANPFCPAAAELGAIDARLAELAAGSAAQDAHPAAAAPAVACPAAPLLDAQLGSEDGLAALKAEYLRARAEALAMAHRLRDIDASLAALRACDSVPAAH